MKNLLNWRYFALAALGCICFILLIAVPSADVDDLHWLGCVLVIKSLAALTFGLTYYLYSHWVATGRIRRLSDNSPEME